MMDSALHVLGGFALALPWSWLPRSYRLARLRDIDFYAWNREVSQHDPELTPHQIAEAAAWGAGARRVLRLTGTPYPPPYPA
jgi:hypothetical protein